MNDTEFKPVEMLKMFGIDLVDIPKRNAKTPDFEARVGNEVHLVELKIKGDDPQEIKDLEDQLKQGEIVTKVTPVAFRNTLSGIVKDAVDQMDTHDPNKKFFHIAWLHCSGQDPKIHWDRFHATLYGTDTLMSLRRDSLMLCYFFRDSAFFRWKESLDGAFLTTLEEGQLCINSSSPRATEFRRSEFVSRFSEALCDPQREQNEGALIADCDIDRKNTDALLTYLKSKYELDHLQVMSLSSITGIVAIPP